MLELLMWDLLVRLDWIGMGVTALLIWPDRDRYILAGAFAFGLDDEEKIAKAAAMLLCLAVIAWPISLGAYLRDRWPDP